MKCSGIKCITPITTNPVPDFYMQMPVQMQMQMPQPSSWQLDALLAPPVQLPRPPFDNFIFKQSNKLKNIRG